jgi:hypothetical protein
MRAEARRERVRHARRGAASNITRIAASGATISGIDRRHVDG